MSSQGGFRVTGAVTAIAALWQCGSACVMTYGEALPFLLPLAFNLLQAKEKWLNFQFSLQTQREPLQVALPIDLVKKHKLQRRSATSGK